MAEPKKVGDIEITQNLSAQKKTWIVQRVGWVSFLGVLIAAGLGLIGGQGPLNNAVAANEHITVEYQAYAHRVASTELTFTLKNLDGENAHLYIERDLLTNYQIQRITPEPDSVRTAAGLLVYEFNIEEGQEDMDVNFFLEPNSDTVGRLSGKVGHSSQQLVSLNQFIYP